MPNIIPKRNSWFVFIACALLMGGVCWFFSDTVFHHIVKRMDFTIPVIVLGFAFAYFSYHWLITLKDPAYEEKSGRIWGCIVFAALFVLYIGGWSAQYKADVEAKIQFDKPVTK